MSAHLPSLYKINTWQLVIFVSIVRVVVLIPIAEWVYMMYLHLPVRNRKFRKNMKVMSIFMMNHSQILRVLYFLLSTSFIKSKVLLAVLLTLMTQCDKMWQQWKRGCTLRLFKNKSILHFNVNSEVIVTVCTRREIRTYHCNVSLVTVCYYSELEIRALGNINLTNYTSRN